MPFYDWNDVNIRAAAAAIIQPSVAGSYYHVQRVISDIRRGIDNLKAFHPCIFMSELGALRHFRRIHRYAPAQFAPNTVLLVGEETLNHTTAIRMGAAGAMYRYPEKFFPIM
jgi:hypothetical protein